MKNYLRYASIVSLTIGSLLLVSCRDQITPLDVNPAPIQADAARTEFTKAFSKAISKDVALRKFLKREALKIFDGDCDVFFHAHKNTIVHDGLTLSTIIGREYQGENFDQVMASLPLLNLLVPMNRTANAWTWDPDKEIPLVVVLNSKAYQKGSKTVTAYGADGNSTEIDAFKEPGKVVLVVEDSERIELSSPQLISANNKSPLVPYFVDGSNNYYFIGARFVSKSAQAEIAARKSSIPTWWGDYIKGYSLNSSDYFDGGLGIYETMWNKIPEVFIKDTAPQYNLVPAGQVNRRTLYYKKDTSLNPDVKERMMYFKFKTFSDAVSAADGWTESSIEVEFNLFFGAPQDGSTFEAEYRRFTAPPMTYAIEDALQDPNPINQLAFQQMRDDLTAQGYITTIDNTFNNTHQGIWANAYAEMVNWSPFKYGDKMQYVFRERDLGQENTYESTWTAGFNVGFDYGVKDVWKFSISANYSTNTKMTYKYTDNSDPLGAVTVGYDELVGFARSSYDWAGIRCIIQTK